MNGRKVRESKIMIEQTDNQSSTDHTADEAPTVAGAVDADPEPPPRLRDDERPSSNQNQVEAAPRISVDILHAAGDWSAIKDVDELIHAAATGVAQHQAFPAGPILTFALALSDDAAIQDLNHRYRGLDKPTNVLSFPALPGPPQKHPPGNSGEHTPEETRFIGDIMLAAQTILREAREQQKLASHHLQHLVIHGILHLLGFDHECDADANVMEAIEVDILRSLKIPNPYNETVPGAIDA